MPVNRSDRARLKQQRPCVVWFTGLSGAGKSTLAGAVEHTLVQAGVHTAVLDGDDLRRDLCRDLGFTAVDRAENIRRATAAARLMADAGLIVLCAFISPFARERELARAAVPAGEFLEVFVATPLATCVARDPKGLYARALAGKIHNVTGVDQPYEVPRDPDLVVGRDNETVADAANRIIAALMARGIVRRPRGPGTA